MTCIKTDKYTIFFGPETAFSQMHPASIVLDGQQFNCSEQYYMFNKAKTFNDRRAMQDIMNTSNPKQQKQIEKTIKGFNRGTWDKKSPDIVRKATMAKVKYIIF